jgi:hypothetical protein
MKLGHIWQKMQYIFIEIMNHFENIQKKIIQLV